MIDKIFHQVIDALTRQAGRSAESLIGTSTSGPERLDVTAVDRMSITKELATLEADGLYRRALTEPSSEANQARFSVAAKLQSDTVARLRRDLIRRHRPRLTIYAAEATRRLRQADDLPTVLLSPITRQINVSSRNAT